MDPARDRRRPQQDAPRAELRRRRDPRRGDDAVPAVRPARPERRARAACRCSGASRPASSARSRPGTRRACSGCGSSRRRSPSATPSSSSPTRRRRSCGGAMFEAVFREAGLPEGLLHVVLGGADVGEAIVTDPNVTRVSFTGSTAAGRRVGALAGELLKRVSLELGGNNAFVVLDDADLEAAASAGAFASFQFQGQVCFATGRHIVHRSVAADYVDLLDREGAAPPARRPVPRGRRPRADRQPEAARAGRRHRPAVGRGRRARRRRRHARGPVLPADRAHRRHDRPAGLARGDLRPGRAGRRRSTPTRRRSRSPTTASTASTGAVYSRSISRGLALAQRFRSGMVHVNDQTVNDEATIPFGGMGASGNGAPLRRRGQLGRVHRVAVGDGPRRAAFVPVPVLIAARPMSSITEVARLAGVSTGDRVARRLRGRLPGQRRDPRARARGRPRRSTTSRTPSPAACSRAASRSSRVIVHDITDPYFAEVVRGVEDAASAAGYLVITCSSERDAERERVVRPAAPLDARGGGRVRGQRARRPGAERGDGPPPRGDARRRRGGRPPLAARRRRARGRRRQRGGDRGDGRGARRAGPPRDRVPRRAVVAVRRRGNGSPATGAGSRRRGSPTTSGWSSGRRSTRRAGRWASTRCAAGGVPFTAIVLRERPARDRALCSGWQRSASTSRARSRSRASTTSRPRR